MKRYEFRLDISPEAFLAYYRGAARQVVVGRAPGPALQFPAALLQPFVTPSGIHGDFILTCEDDLTGAKLQRRA